MMLLIVSWNTLTKLQVSLLAEKGGFFMNHFAGGVGSHEMLQELRNKATFR